MMFVSDWISARSQQDFLHLAEILLRLARSCLDCRDFPEIAEISPRLPISHQDCRDLALMFVSFWNSVRLQRDFLHLAKIAEILPWCLGVSRISLKSLQDFLHLAKISKISPRLPRSQSKFCRGLSMISLKITLACTSKSCWLQARNKSLWVL